MVIDSHHHFWNYNAREYDWITHEMQRIRRSFLPAALKETLDQTGVDGVVSVQARQSLEETQWLLSLAQDHEFLLGVVGWLPLASETISQVLEQYAGHPKLKGVRHVVQGEPAGFLDGRAFNEGISQLKAHNLVYDVLIFEHQLEEAIRFVDRHPEQLFVLDHIAKPRIAAAEIEPWATQLGELAKREHVYCKLSGMVTEADLKHWNVEQLAPYAEVVLEAFGPKRVLLGSDWPVCLLGVEYAQWLGVVRGFIQTLTADEQANIMGKNAQRAYSL